MLLSNINIQPCTDGWDRRGRGYMEWRKGTGWAYARELKSQPRLIKYAPGQTRCCPNPRGWNCWRLIKSFFFFFFGSLLAIIIVTRTHIFTTLLQDPRCLYEPTTTKKKKKTSKKAKNNQHRQGRLILFVRSSYYRCVCIINERSLSNWYCSWFVAVRVPGEIDGQVNDLSSALVSALLRRRLKNYNMRFDRKKRSWPACLVVVSEFILNIYICMHIYIIQTHWTIIMETNLQYNSKFFCITYIMLLYSQHKQY